MRKSLFAFILAWALAFSSAYAAGSPVTDGDLDAAERLRKIGFEISDEWLVSYAEETAAYREQPASYGYDFFPFEQDTAAYYMLQSLGLGQWNDEEEDYTPVSDQIYAFDAEVWDIERMYTVFLSRAAEIVPGLTIGDIREDLSGLNDNLEGRRAVSFTMDDVEFGLTLQSMRDWLNTEIVDYVNECLSRLDYDGQLYVVSDDVDQIVMLVYGSKAWADTVRAAIGSSNLAEKTGPLDIILGLFR